MSLIRYVTKIHFAERVLEDAVEAELGFLGLARPLVVSDNGPDRRRVTDRLVGAMPANVAPTLYETASAVVEEADCAAVADLYRESEADGLISFGGAVAMGLAKAAGVMLGHPRPLRHYAGSDGGGMRIRDAIPPTIAIPTAAGACCEALGVSVVVFGDGSVGALSSPHLTPRVLICDPTLTLDLSARQIAGAGMDALTHCIETYVATAYNPPADGIALDGLRRLALHLERAVEDGADLDARRETMAAALNGALASQKGLGGVHAMSHALAGAVPAAIDHGAVNGVLLPLVLEFNAPAVATRYAGIRHGLGLHADADLPEAIRRLRARLGLPARLAETGVAGDDLARAAALASTDHANRTNPRHAGAADYLAMLAAAL